jgi:hypothetical protein
MDETEKNENDTFLKEKGSKDIQSDEEPNIDELIQLLEEATEENNYQSEEITSPHAGVSISEDFDESFKYCSNCGRELLHGECLYCAEEMEKVEAEEYEDFEKRPHTKWRNEMRRKGELNMAGIFCVVVAAIYLIYISFPEVTLALTGDFIIEHFLFHFILLLIAIGALFGGFVMARHAIIYGRLFDTTFEKEIYSRLEPAFAEVGKVRGDFQELYDKMDRMNLHIERLERKAMVPIGSEVHTTDISAAMRYILLMGLSLGAFFFILRYPQDYVPYVLTALYLIWWAGVTSDFKLWKVSVSWTWPFFAVVVVPIASILIDIIYGIGIMIGIVGMILTIYTLSYYAWARYYVEGIAPDVLPFLGDEE